MTTPTPRTDELVGKQLQDFPEWVDASFARQLERDLAAAQETVRLSADPDGLWVHFKCGGQHYSYNLSADHMARKFCAAYLASIKKEAP